MSSDFKWRHYRGEVILWVVRWYCRYGISYRELEEMLEERGVDVDHMRLRLTNGPREGWRKGNINLKPYFQQSRIKHLNAGERFSMRERNHGL